MQQFALGKDHGTPDHVERLILYLAPDGGVYLEMGNQLFYATVEETAKVVARRLAHHEMYGVFLGDRQGSIQA
jgi:hypothetical protein